MTGKQLRQYCFKNESQWKMCLFSQADRDALRSGSGFRPFPPYAGEPSRHESQGAQAPVVLRTGEILWSDNNGMLHWSSTDDVTSEAFPAPPSIARASRVVSMAGGLWARATETFARELLGSSDGEPNMSLRLARPPVLDHTLELRVKEPLGEEDRKELLTADAANVLREGDRLCGNWVDWVLWKQVTDPNDEPADPRVYALDESTGKIRFGNGLRGRIPPIGRDSIVAFSYKRSKSLECYDEETLTRLITVDLPNSRILDITRWRKDTLVVLVERDGKLQGIRVSEAGHEVGAVPFTGISQAKAFIFLRSSKRFVVLAGDRHPCLYWFEENGGQAVFSKPVAVRQPDFKADVLGSDSNERIVLAGSDRGASARGASVLILDADGDWLGDVPLAAQATGITATPHQLIVTDARGLLRYHDRRCRSRRRDNRSAMHADHTAAAVSGLGRRPSLVACRCVHDLAGGDNARNFICRDRRSRSS